MSLSTMQIHIADITIAVQSRWPHENLALLEREQRFSERYRNFFGQRSQTPDIIVQVEIVDTLPDTRHAQDLFITYHPDDRQENWRLMRRGAGYIYGCPLKDKEQVMMVNNDLTRVRAFVLPKPKNRRVWNVTDIIYDFLQVLLIGYLSKYNRGVFVHAVGIKDQGRGLIFAGKSSAGKTTTAGIWHRYSHAMILNDDRIIVRRKRNGFVMYGTPWHGTFDDYLFSRIESAPLERLFFIHKARENATAALSPAPAFAQLYPTILPPFWDKRGLTTTAAFCEAMVRRVPCFNFAFAKNKSIIPFVRSR